jgi:glycosyltransferase 2 family protein
MKQMRLNLTKSGKSPVLNKKVKERLIFIIKVILSLIAIIYVLKRVSIGDIINVIKSARDIYLVFAFLLFVASKLMSAWRTLLILQQYGIPISVWDNLKLYWTGMFYNLFLPGGIGGDVYKTLVINNMHKNGIKISAGSVLTDRIAGVAALIVLALLCLPLTGLSSHYGWVTLAGVPITFIGFIGMILIFMPQLKGIIGRLLTWSFIVQVFQMVAIYFILVAFSIKTEQIEYMLIFLISSIAAMLPISVGGIGIREMVFFKLSDYLFLDQKVAVAISLTFYLITVLASSLGIISALEKRRNKKSVSATIINT